MSVTSIEWTDKTWNPTRGCSLVSEGCRKCYAMKFAHRFSGKGEPYEGLTELGPDGPRWTGRVLSVPEKLDEPLKWRKPAKVFVNSMSDLFHEDVPFEFIDKVFAVMALCPQHTFQVLTKRADRMLEYNRREGFAQNISDIARDDYAGIGESRHIKKYPIGPNYEFGERWFIPWPLPNVWLGVSCEDRQRKDRIDHLRETPAAVRFLSLEPLLEDLGRLDLRGIHWVIVGGESGPKARPMHPEWVRSIRDQCVAAGVKFFLKQWGEWGTTYARLDNGEPVFRMFENKQQWINKASTWINGGICVDLSGRVLQRGADFYVAAYPVVILQRVGKKAAGRLLDGREWNEFPEVRR